MRAECNPTSTFGLLERVRAGEEQAFAELFHKYSSRLAVLVHYRMSPELRGQIEVDDILQETFLAASRQLDKFEYRNPGSFMSWLVRIADHVIVDAARHRGRQKRRPAEMVRLRTPGDPGGAEAVDSLTPSRVLAHKERIRRVLQKLDALPDDYRQVILLAKLAGLSTQETAERLGRSRLNIAVLLHRAVQRLKELDAASES